MPSETRLLKHLDYLQQVINRMATNSASVKTWVVTVTAAILALSLGQGREHFAWVAIVPILSFWILDSYYLHQERLFRQLYDRVRIVTDDSAVDFSMETSVASSADLLKVFFSRTMLLFYLPLILIFAGTRWLA